MKSQNVAPAEQEPRVRNEPLFDFLPHPTVLLDAEGSILSVNPAFAALIGQAPELLTDASFRLFVAPGFLRSYDAFATFSAGTASSLECRLRTAGGREIWVLLTMSELDRMAAAKVCLQCVPIEEQRAREAACRHREERLQMALDGAGQGVWDHDMVLNRAHFSDTWKAMRGYRPDEDVDALAGSWLERLHPEDRPRIEAMINEQNVGRKQQNAFEYRERHRDGHWMWIFSRGRPVEWLPNGHVARILGTDTDITSLKEIESSLAEEKARLLVTLGSIADGMISLDSEFKITLLNGAAERIAGIQAAACIDHPITDIIDLRTADGVPLTKSVITQCMETGIGVTLPDDTMLYHAAHQVYLHCSISPVKSPDGRIMGLVMVFRDTTDDQLAKRALAHSATHDALTGLANRYAFEHAIETLVSCARAEKRAHVLCYLDLDAFKHVNDNAGHAAGDEVLRKVAEIFSSGCRATDFVARLGGDEFAIVLGDCPRQKAETICNAIVRRVSAHTFTFKDQCYRIGVSIGMTTIDAASESAAAVRELADIACYEAKANGKGCVVSL